MASSSTSNLSQRRPLGPHQHSPVRNNLRSGPPRIERIRWRTRPRSGFSEADQQGAGSWRGLSRLKGDCLGLLGLDSEPLLC